MLEAIRKIPDRALPLVKIWSQEVVNKLVERETFIDSVGRECTQLKN